MLYNDGNLDALDQDFEESCSDWEDEIYND